MKDTYAQLMSRLPMKEPSPKASARVMARIEQTEISRLRARVGAFATVAVAAIAAFIPLVSSAWNTVAQSGFIQYASLIASDSSYAFANWKDLMLSMADSLPVMALILCLAILLVFVSSLRSTLRYRSLLSSHI